MIDRIKLARRVQEYRAIKGLSMEKMAELLNVSFVTMFNVEHASEKTREINLVKIEVKLNNLEGEKND